jgi:ATP phosphoribosyltransferase regulatory subunit HisZ
LTSSISETLRYDLTVPFARCVVHQNDIEFPLRDIKSNLFGVPGRKNVQEFFNVMMW